MNRTIVIFKINFAYIMKSRIYKIIFGLLMLLIAGTLIFTGYKLNGFFHNFPAELSSGQDKKMAQTIFTQLVMPLSAMMVFIAAILPYTLIMWIIGTPVSEKDKASGIIETQLATPLLPIELWLGKSMSLIAPSFIMAVSSVLLCACGLSAIQSVILKKIIFNIQPQVIISSILLSQFFFSGVIALVVFITLAYSAEMSLLPSLITGIGILNLYPIGAGLKIIDPAGWSFVLIMGLMTIAIWLLILPFFSFFKKEKMILNMKKE